MRGWKTEKEVGRPRGEQDESLRVNRPLSDAWQTREENFALGGEGGATGMVGGVGKAGRRVRGIEKDVGVLGVGEGVGATENGCGRVRIVVLVGEVRGVAERGRRGRRRMRVRPGRGVREVGRGGRRRRFL